VTQSGHTLELIVTSIKKVTDIVGEIAAASREQSLGIEQVSKAVLQMDEMTQQNAALVEQSTAASQSMAEQARGLRQTMERYRLDGPAALNTPVSATVQSPARVAAGVARTRPERRSATRAWAAAGNSKPAQRLPSRPQPVLVAVAAGNGADAEWSEF
jgi:hypothetical protein